MSHGSVQPGAQRRDGMICPLLDAEYCLVLRNVIQFE